MSALLAGAFAYARIGIAVFPCKPCRKEPLIMGWQERATTDEDQIERWWREHPSANVATPTGRRWGRVVIDVDAAGLETWRDWLAVAGRIETQESLTPRGGLHAHFAAPDWPVKTSAGELAVGIDVRGEGGLVVLPPSRTAGGAYVWELSSRPDEVPLAPLPTWLAEKLRATARPGRTAALLPEFIPAGQRNQTLLSLAGTMRRRGASLAAITAALLAENASRCLPPLGEDEVLRIAQSVARYAPANSRPKPAQIAPAEPDATARMRLPEPVRPRGVRLVEYLERTR